MSHDRRTPTAFVIMPFDEASRPIYDKTIRPILTKLGFDVSRADDLLNQRNILRDILSSISSADLIVADLTGSNPNVYYELGLAHALRRRAILLVQHIDEIPFDLAGYRVIVYGTRPAQLEDARSELQKTGEMILSGSMKFGNPVSDFLKLEIEEKRPSMLSSTLEEQNTTVFEERSLVDHGKELADILHKLTKQTAQIGVLTNKSVGQMKNILSAGGARSDNQLRRAGDRLAKELEQYREIVALNNDRYETVIGETDLSPESLLEFTHVATSDDPTATKERLDSQLTKLRGFLDPVTESRRAFHFLYNVLDVPPKGLLPLGRRLSRIVAPTALQARKMRDSLRHTEAAVSRAIQVGEHVRSELGET